MIEERLKALENRVEQLEIARVARMGGQYPREVDWDHELSVPWAWAEVYARNHNGEWHVRLAGTAFSGQDIALMGALEVIVDGLIPLPVSLLTENGFEHIGSLKRAASGKWMLHPNKNGEEALREE